MGRKRSLLLSPPLPKALFSPRCSSTDLGQGWPGLTLPGWCSTALQTRIWSCLLLPRPRQEGRASSRAGRGKPQDWGAWAVAGKEGNGMLPGFDYRLGSVILVNEQSSVLKEYVECIIYLHWLGTRRYQTAAPHTQEGESRGMKAMWPAARWKDLVGRVMVPSQPNTTAPRHPRYPAASHRALRLAKKSPWEGGERRRSRQ